MFRTKKFNLNNVLIIKLEVDEEINDFLLFNVIRTWQSTFHLHPHVGGFFEQDNLKVMKTSKVIGDDLSSNAQNTLNSLHKGGQKL
jgi:hypothetical protein